VAAYYLDSSALVKRYISEAGSEVLAVLLDPDTDHDLYTVTLARVEIIAAVVRRSRGDRALADALETTLAFLDREFIGRIDGIPVSDMLIEYASTLARSCYLRGYDTLHLAACILMSHARSEEGAEPLTLVSADEELNRAAMMEGITVLNPNTAE
jgi:uncharacterized protein